MPLLLSFFRLLMLAGVCQGASVTDTSGKPFDAVVCPWQPILTGEADKAVENFKPPPLIGPKRKG